MTILFIHQSFPGQFKNIVRYLAANAENDIRFISRPNANGIPAVRRYTYEPARESAKQTHHYVRDLERGVLNGQAVALKVRELLASGFQPDVVVGHSGWGETLFIKDVLPSTPLLSYFEFFYKAFGADTNFDPEYPLGLDDSFRIRIKNAVNHTGMDAADWGLTPTNWQRSLYPAWAQKRMTVLHEGIDTSVVLPDPDARFRLPNGVSLSPGAKLVTYVARNLEPYRGIHTFVRSIPGIIERQRARQHVEARYDFARCIRPQFEALLSRLAKPHLSAAGSRSCAPLHGRSQNAGRSSARVWHAVH